MVMKIIHASDFSEIESLLLTYDPNDFKDPHDFDDPSDLAPPYNADRRYDSYYMSDFYYQNGYKYLESLIFFPIMIDMKNDMTVLSSIKQSINVSDSNKLKRDLTAAILNYSGIIIRDIELIHETILPGPFAEIYQTIGGEKTLPDDELEKELCLVAEADEAHQSIPENSKNRALQTFAINLKYASLDSLYAKYLSGKILLKKTKENNISEVISLGREEIHLGIKYLKQAATFFERERKQFFYDTYILDVSEIIRESNYILGIVIRDENL
jgi:hypothetical protein